MLEGKKVINVFVYVCVLNVSNSNRLYQESYREIICEMIICEMISLYSIQYLYVYMTGEHIYKFETTDND